MSEQEYSQFLFEKHDQNKFHQYIELRDFKGFMLQNDKNKTKYLLDEDEGWCDLNGCYYNSLGEPSGWIILSKNGTKYMKFNLNTEFIEEQQNIYYSNKQFDATLLELNQQRLNNKNDQQQQQQQQIKQDNRKQYNQSNQKNQDQQRKQKYNKQKDQEDQEDEKTKEQQEEDLYVEKIDQQLPQEINNTNNDPKINDQEAQQRKQRDRKQNDRNRKKQNQNQDNNESKKKYYILNINDNSLNKEEFIKYLIEECKIKEENIIEYNENILKLAQDKDAIKLYRLNKKQQADKVQKFIVST